MRSNELLKDSGSVEDTRSRNDSSQENNNLVRANNWIIENESYWLDCNIIRWRNWCIFFENGVGEAVAVNGIC